MLKTIKDKHAKMKAKIYNSPEISLVDLEARDIITTSDIEAGVETTPVPDNGGTWETL